VAALAHDLRVIAASRSFYSAFKVSFQETQGRLLYELGNGQWDIPGLRLLLEKIIPERGVMEDYEVEHEFPGVGHRTMRLNARQVFYEGGADTTILLGIEDVTGRRALEREREELLRQKEILLEELQHRVANSLQIIASILLMKARAVSSEETRSHLRDAHQRVMSVAAVQSHLHVSDGIDQIEVGSYLFKLCGSLADSMIGENQPIKLKVVADNSRLGSTQVVSIGLIVTELVINALKYAFPAGKARAVVHVTYESDGEDWRLVISDNGVGKEYGGPAAKGGLGTVIVGALVKQLEARMEVRDAEPGLSVSITRASFTSRVPKAA